MLKTFDFEISGTKTIDFCFTGTIDIDVDDDCNEDELKDLVQEEAYNQICDDIDTDGDSYVDIENFEFKKKPYVEPIRRSECLMKDLKPEGYCKNCYYKINKKCI